MRSRQAKKAPPRETAVASDEAFSVSQLPCAQSQEPTIMFDQDDLLALAQMSMPYGKYQGWLLIDLPEPYLLWFADNGFPENRLGHLLALALEIKINGLEHLLKPLKQPSKQVRPQRPRFHLVNK